MTPSPGVSHDSGYICKLKKALYGLKQAPCAWFVAKKILSTVWYGL